MNLTVSPLHFLLGVGHATPLERPQQRQTSQIPTLEHPSASPTVFAPALTGEQTTKFRYLGMAEALRRLIDGSGIDQASFGGPAISGNGWGADADRKRSNVEMKSTEAIP